MLQECTKLSECQYVIVIYGHTYVPLNYYWYLLFICWCGLSAVSLVPVLCCIVCACWLVQCEASGVASWLVAFPVVPWINLDKPLFGLMRTASKLHTSHRCCHALSLCYLVILHMCCIIVTRWLDLVGLKPNPWTSSISALTLLVGSFDP